MESPRTTHTLGSPIRLLAGFIAVAFLTIAASNAAAQLRVGISYQNYVPPAWAPPYDNVSSTEYYYFPDYDMYYDVWTGEFWYLDNDSWRFSEGLPPMYADMDLNSAYIVLIDRHIHNPWYNHAFYARNYPHHSYDGYRNIVVRDRIVRNIAPNHELVPRAYNENNRRVTFMQHPVGGKAPGSYRRVVNEVPIRTIAPSMPKASRSYNYGGASNRARNVRPAPVQQGNRAPQYGNRVPHGAPAPQNRGNTPNRGNSQGQGGQRGGGGAPGGDRGNGQKH